MLKKILIVALAASMQIIAMQQPTQQLSKMNFMGASVLPYTRWKPKGQGKAYFLLSREADGKDKGTYDAFGGSKDPGENHPVVTAAREFSEETIGLLYNPKQALDFIDVKTGNTHAVIAHEQKKFAVYITKFAPKDLEHIVNNFYAKRATPGLAHHYKEKDKLAWVSWENLENAIKNAKRDPITHKLITPIKVWANVVDSNGKKHAEEISLRPVFVSSLQSYFAGKAPKALGKDSRIKYY